MPRPPVAMPPESVLPRGPLRTLTARLHELYRAAGCPSPEVLAGTVRRLIASGELREHMRIGRETIRKMLQGQAKLIRSAPVEALTYALTDRHVRDPYPILEEMHQLWLAVAAELTTATAGAPGSAERPRLLLLTSMPEVTEEVTALLRERLVETVESGPYRLRRLREDGPRVTVAEQTRHGGVAVVAQQIGDLTSGFDAVLDVQLCAGLNPDEQRVGDIVVADRIVLAGPADPVRLLPSLNLLHHARTLHPAGRRVHVGTLELWERLPADAGTVATGDRRDQIAVLAETGVFAFAQQVRRSIPWLLLAGIADFGGPQRGGADDTGMDARQVAARQVAGYAFDLADTLADGRVAF